jgi:glycosyltransferase 2 family protein
MDDHGQMQEPPVRERDTPDDPKDEADEPQARGWTVLGTVISIAALIGVVVWATQQEAPTLPSSPAEILALVGAIATYGVTTSLRGERWWRLLEDSEANATRADSYGLTVVGYMGNNVLPARGGDVMRAVLLKPRATASLRTIFGTLVAERLLDVVFLLSLFAVLAYAVIGDIETPDTDLLLLGGIGGLALLLACGFAIYLLRDRPIVARGIKLIAPLVEPTRRLRGMHAAAMLGWTALIWISEGLMFVFVADSVGVEMDLVQAGYLMAVASVFLLVPAGPGNIGTLDAAVLFGLGAIGTSGSEALSYLLMYRFVIFVPITLAGVILLLTRYRRPPPRAAEAG